MGPLTTQRRDELWLPLLASITEEFPAWGVWKNVESALAGTGDVDSFSPPEHWPGIQRHFTEWAGAQRLGPVLTCRHIPQGPHFITVEPDSPYLVQLDVKTRGTFRGSTLIDAWTLPALSEIDNRGFRRVRPGVEGIIKLCLNGTRRGGRPNSAALQSKGVRALLAADPEGVERGAALLGWARRPALRGAHAVLNDGWDQRAMASVEAWSAIRSVAEPRTALSRWWFLHVVAPRCPVIQLIRTQNRRIEGDPIAWIRSMAHNHDLAEVAR